MDTYIHNPRPFFRVVTAPLTIEPLFTRAEAEELQRFYGGAIEEYTACVECITSKGYIHGAGYCGHCLPSPYDDPFGPDLDECPEPNEREPDPPHRED